METTKSAQTVKIEFFFINVTLFGRVVKMYALKFEFRQQLTVTEHQQHPFKGTFVQYYLGEPVPER